MPHYTGADMQKVLLIDDDEDFTELNSALLLQDGFSVTTARDGLEGVALAKALKPDIVVVDLLMPRMTGFDVCQQLRQELPTLKIIVLSGKSFPIDQRAAGRLGADRFLSKPSSPREVLANVKELLAAPEP
ncbi:MAG: two-component system, OmpR family, alkaline phosphatase synthesis response regulator PhoP [Elusimicrobia bacterium]|nr:MAG: two-component system, OmpR family, alkaline phosphatase synthesis response regulator PhoP [Elusimicrobiota bacterium]